jgi:molybdate transport system ATP-binding protein
VAALVGPNGAGKSSIVQLVSGQLRPDTGTVTLGGRLLCGPSTWVPVHRRRVALLEQRPLLFEHLDVLDNVAFGLRARGIPAATAHDRARREIDAVGCLELTRHRTWQLSGGQAQRIALARALAADPDLVVLDEPMAALDVTVAPAIRALLRQRITAAGRTALLVTHDIVDALTLADTLAVVDQGRIVDTGTVTEQLLTPRTPFVADLVGVNLLVGRANGADQITLPTGEHVTGLSDMPLPLGHTALASFTPAAVAVHTAEPTGSPRTQLRATVTTLEPRGPLMRLTSALADGTGLAADLTTSAALEARLSPGSQVWLVVKAAQVALYPR